MCSCDTSSGRTVSAQRQAAFSSCSRGAMALARGVPPEPGRPGCRSRLHRRPNGLRHLPAMRTRRSLSQLASQSPVRASAWAPARAPAPDPHDRPQSASADTRHPPHPQTLEVYSPPRWAHARSQQSLRLPRLWPDGRRKGKPLVETLATSSPALQGKRPQLLSRIAFCAPLVFQAGTSRAKVCLFLLSGTSPLTVKDHARGYSTHTIGPLDCGVGPETWVTRETRVGSLEGLTRAWTGSDSFPEPS